MTHSLRSAVVAASLLAALLLAGCDSSDPGADIIFYNGVVLTIDGSATAPTAIAITGDKIESVGSDDAVRELEGSKTQLIDLGGRTIMPGFVDPHTHILNDASSLDMTLAEAQNLALEHGITAIGDLYVDEDFLADMRALDESGELRLRTSLYLVATSPCGELLGNWYRDYSPETEPGQMLRVAGVKLFTDGGSCGLPAYGQPAPDIGDLWFTQEQLNDLVAEVDSLGFQAAIHAIGDRGLDQAQTAIEAALAGRPNDLRHRIEHNAVIRPEQLGRYAEIGIVPIISSSSFACSLFYIGEAFVGEERTSWIAPYRSLLDAGTEHVAWHSDYPFNSPDPLLHIFNLVTGKQIAGSGGADHLDREGVVPGEICEPPEWALAQTLTVDQALRMTTIDAAYALGMESVVGSLAPGKLADVIVLSGDPLTVDALALDGIDVLVTIVGGRTAYCSADEPGLCPKAD